MEFDVWGQTDVGLKRDNNQDSILVDRKLQLFIVADGMGGHRGGEVASALAVETMQEVFENEIFENKDINPRELLKKAYKEASRRIYIKSTRENPDLMGMGTTMVAAFSYNGKIFVANVGDSRAYLFRDDNLWQLTEDHSLINEQIRHGIVDANNPESFIGRNVITRSVGFEEMVDVDLIEREITPGEIFLLCSDGLSGMVSNEKIAEIIKRYSLSEAVTKCIQEAKNEGGDDNISVIIFQAKEPS